MDPYRLPDTLTVAGEEYPIRSDFRAILDILIAQIDPELDDQHKAEVLLRILYVRMPPVEHLQEAYDKACAFIDAGITDDGKQRPRVMDWEQDAPLIIPAVNRVAGTEVRSLQYLHWWTFLGYYQEIGESYYSEIVSIRLKKAKGKKLEKYEQEFYRDNKAAIDLEEKGSGRSEEEKDALRELFGIKKR